MHAEFPRMPAWDDGDLCSHLPSHSVLEAIERTIREARDYRSRSWLLLPPGGGKSHILRCLRERYPSRLLVESKSTLSEAPAHSNSSLPLILEIAERASNDQESLERLQERPGDLIILSPFSFPHRIRGQSERRGLDVPTYQPDFNVLAYGSRGASWRRPFLRAISERLATLKAPSKLVVEEVLEWLSANDPSECLVSTPGGLLALCADFDRYGNDGASYFARANRWLADIGDEFGGRGGRFASSYRLLLEKHLRDRRYRLDSRPTSSWMNLASEVDDRCNVDSLRGAGLLRGANRGLVIYPAWVEHGLLVDGVVAELRSGDPERWGALAADKSRRDVVDAAFDSLAVDELFEISAKVSERGEPRTLAGRAAVESLLPAMARKLSLSDSRPNPKQLRDLHGVFCLLEAWEHYEDCYDDAFTRKSFDEWYATHWALSLILPCPIGDTEDPGGWEMPGWTSVLSLKRLPLAGLPVLYRYASRDREPFGHWMSLLAERIVGRIEDETLPEKVPDILRQAIMRIAPSRGWDARKLLRQGRLWPLETPKPITSYTLKRQDRGHCACSRCQRLIPVDYREETRLGKLHRLHGLPVGSGPLYLCEAVRLACEHRMQEEAKAVARHLWELSPEHAEQAALSILPESFDYSFGQRQAETWYRTAPRERLVPLVDALLALPKLPSWAMEWAVECALDGGEAAEKMYAIALEERKLYGWGSDG